MKFYDTLVEVIKHDERFFSIDGEILRNAIYEAAMQMDAKLIKLLLENETTQERFFTNIDGVFVFDKVGFGWVVNNRQFLPDSYTRFKNKIGLTNAKGELISASNDVELVFPYKDCILEGGQTKDDQKRSEIFYNETLAPDEVDRLLYPKVFVNTKRYTVDGVMTEIEYQHSDNLIIKGNNLLAISSLLKRYRGKVKCIYIDPPYNTGSDEFNYNDNFNHSSWLTFMKNRIEMAHKLLQKDGAMFLHIDYHELGYIIPLMDEIFGKQNCVQIISVKTASPAGFKTVNPGPIDVTEYILFYTRQRESFKFKKIYVPTSYDKNYDLYIENPNEAPSNWKLEKLYNVIYKENGIDIGKTPQQSIKNAKEKWGDYWKTIRLSLMSDFALKNADRVVSIRDPQKPTQELKELMNKSAIEREKIFVYQKTANDDCGYVINGGSLSFYSKKIKDLDGEITPTELLTDMWRDISWDGIANEGGVKLKNGKKPEKLLRRIIEMSTEKNDIVLDYHLGSGTTCAVAHKMERQYIGVEQLDYAQNDSIVRLKNVINNDTTGISAAVNWKGGGSFVYCEFAKLNQNFVEQIQEATDIQTLEAIWNEIKETGFISSNLNLKEIDKSATDFSALSLDDKKRFLMEILDKNMLYVNYCDIDDAEFNVSDEDKAFTKSFYKGV